MSHVHETAEIETETNSYWSPEIENSVDEEVEVEVCACGAYKDGYGSWVEA